MPALFFFRDCHLATNASDVPCSPKVIVRPRKGFHTKKKCLLFSGLSKSTKLTTNTETAMLYMESPQSYHHKQNLFCKCQLCVILNCHLTPTIHMETNISTCHTVQRPGSGIRSNFAQMCVVLSDNQNHQRRW